MNIHFNFLFLQCKRSKEKIDLTSQISFFYGQISSGKSSIAKLIDYCLGGEVEKTPAINKELISATLDLVIGDYQVILERTYETNKIQCTWMNDLGEQATVLAPVIPEDKAIWSDNIFSLSDLLFYLLGKSPIKIASNQNIDEAALNRLSFRNFMWYCYLDQQHLDSSFFRLEDTMRKRNSRAIQKYILKFSSEKLTELEEEYIKTKEERSAKTVTVSELKQFLKKVGYDSISEIEKDIKNTHTELEKNKVEKKKMEGGYLMETHSSDQTRAEIQNLTRKIDEITEALSDLQRTLEDQVSLRAELITSKFKLARTETVVNILSGVDFENCPSCGSSLKDKFTEPDHCKLCNSDLKNNEVNTSENAEIIRLDLDSRIKDIDDSILNHKKSVSRQQKQLTTLTERKSFFEIRLAEELKNYESIFLSNIRNIDRNVATLQERIKGYQKLKEFPSEIKKLEENIDLLILKEAGLRRDIEEERANLKLADQLIKDLENTFLETLKTIGLPGIKDEDAVIINRVTWEPMIIDKEDEQGNWNFHNAGSLGKKTLFNVCFMLSIHIVASRHKLELPNFMIIDTPMKNIDKEVNEIIFKRFFDYLYIIAEGELDNTQIIIIDNVFIAPNNKNLSFYSRFMTPDNDQNPPLISYYRGS